MPASDRRYCILGIYWSDHPDVPEFLAVESKIVIFDTLDMAREIVPALAPGRMEFWDVTREVCSFSPLVRQGFNRIGIFTRYDPYDVPNGFRSKGIWSEGEGRAWKRHVYWRHVLPELLAWADDLAAKQLAAEEVLGETA